MNQPYPVKRKVGKKEKTEYVRNRDKRIDFIKKFGKDKFIEKSKTSPSLNKLRAYKVPDGFGWIWYQFIKIWRTCSRDWAGNPVITAGTLLEYQQLFRVTFSPVEADLIFLMKEWALEAIRELEKKDE